MSEQEQSQVVEETTQSLLNLSLVNPADEDVIGIVSVSTSPSSDNESSSSSSTSVGGSMAESLQDQIEELKGIIYYMTSYCFILLYMAYIFAFR